MFHLRQVAPWRQRALLLAASCARFLIERACVCRFALCRSLAPMLPLQLFSCARLSDRWKRFRCPAFSEIGIMPEEPCRYMASCHARLSAQILVVLCFGSTWWLHLKVCLLFSPPTRHTGPAIEQDHGRDSEAHGDPHGIARPAPVQDAPQRVRHAPGVAARPELLPSAAAGFRALQHRFVL